MTALDKWAGQRNGVQWVCEAENAPSEACVMFSGRWTMSGGPERQVLRWVV